MSEAILPEEEKSKRRYIMMRFIAMGSSDVFNVIHNPKNIMNMTMKYSAALAGKAKGYVQKRMGRGIGFPVRQVEIEASRATFQAIQQILANPADIGTIKSAAQLMGFLSKLDWGERRNAITKKGRKKQSRKRRLRKERRGGVENKAGRVA